MRNRAIRGCECGGERVGEDHPAAVAGTATQARRRTDWRAITARLAGTAHYSRLGWLLCLALLPGLAVGCVFIGMLYVNGRAQAEQEALLAAHAMTQIFDAEVATRMARLDALATSPALAAGDLDAFHRQAAAVAGGVRADGAPVVLADASGQQLVNTMLPPGARLPRSGAAAAIGHVLATGKPAVSGLFVGSATGKPHVAVLWPVTRPGRETLVLIQGISATFLARRLTHLDVSAGWIASLLDQDGKLVASTADPLHAGRDYALQDMRGVLAGRAEGMLAATTPAGVPVVAAYSRSRETGWTVLVGVHERAMLADVFGGLAWPGALVAAALLAGVIQACWLHRAALRAVHGLIEAGWRAEQGMPGVRAPVRGPREIAQLASQFNRMQQANEQDKQALQLAASVFDATSEGILIVSAEIKIIDANRAFLAMSGYARDELLGQNPRILQSGRQDAAFYARMWSALNGPGNWEGQIWDRRRDGSLFAAYLSVSRVDGPDGKLRHYISLFTDITEQRLRQDEIELLAYRDPLTQLPNRRLLQDRLQQAMAGAARNGVILAVCSLDLDGFKAVNDSYGHEAGDEVLKVVAARLQHVVRANDTVARLGGDEFVLLLVDLQRRQEAQDIVGRALELVATAIPLACGNRAGVSASIGIAYYPSDGGEAEELLRLSDNAMYQAKRRGRNRYVLHGEA